MIEISKYSELDNGTKSKLKDFIDSEFGHIPIVRETQWATPGWTILLYENKEIVTFYNIIERKILVDMSVLKIAGINNVITPEEYRGNGYASKILRETEDFIFDELQSELGVLLCANELIPFYERLNWYKVDCPVYPKKIELNGLPW